jgi:hypothetical protein
MPQRTRRNRERRGLEETGETQSPETQLRLVFPQLSLNGQPSVPPQDFPPFPCLALAP